MKTRKIFTALMLFLIITLSLLAITDRVIHAQGASSSESELSKKLDDVLNNQKTILQELGLIKGELRIITIRITQQQ